MDLELVELAFAVEESDFVRDLYLGWRPGRRERVELLSPAAGGRRLHRQHHVRRLLAGHQVGAAVAEARQVEAGEQVLAAAEQDRRDGEMELVEEARDQVLPGRAAPPGFAGPPAIAVSSSPDPAVAGDERR